MFFSTLRNASILSNADSIAGTINTQSNIPTVGISLSLNHLAPVESIADA